MERETFIDGSVVERLRKQVQDDLSGALGGGGNSDREGMVKEAVDRRLSFIGELPQSERDRVRQALLDEFLYYGPIQTYLDDESITEIMVNGHEDCYIERGGELFKVAGADMPAGPMFPDDESVKRLINRILLPLGRRCDEQRPYADARLPDGSRVNATIPPASLTGPCLDIRKFSRQRVTSADYVRGGSASPEMMSFLNSAVAAKCNILVSGGTGSGKTTLLNVLSTYIPAGERIITIEDSAELKLSQPHVLRREARPPNTEGKGAITVHDLLVNALRERPDRIIVGECRSDEAIEMLQAMNTGHDGSMTTVHANDPRGAFQRIETMVTGSSNLPSRAIRQQIATAIHIVVQVGKHPGGERKLDEIDAIAGMEGDVINLSPLFKYEITNASGHGRHVATGFMPPPAIFQHFAANGVFLDRAWFSNEGVDDL